MNKVSNAFLIENEKIHRYTRNNVLNKVNPSTKTGVKYLF